MNITFPGWCNGSTSDSGSFGLGSSPSPGARWRYGQAAKTSPSQGEIKGSIPFSATTLEQVLWFEIHKTLTKSCIERYSSFFVLEKRLFSTAPTAHSKKSRDSFFCAACFSKSLIYGIIESMYAH